jgi:hypothetical protein
MENQKNNNPQAPFRTLKEKTMYLSILIDDLKIQLLMFETRGDFDKLKSNTEKILENIRKEVNEIRR